MKASNMVLAKDLELQPGTLLHSGNEWHLRVHLEENLQKYEGVVSLGATSLGEYRNLDHPSSCLALLPRLQVEARFIGDIQGPGAAPPGSLVWGREGLSLVGVVGSRLFVGLNGLESDDVLRDKHFFATHWGLWIVDGDGKDVYDTPFLTVKAG